MSEAPTLLPLGSAVKTADDDTYIIIARGFQKSSEGFLAGYKTVAYPLGSVPDGKEVLIRQTEIIQVVHRGFETPEDAIFAKKQFENAKARPAKQPPAPEPDLTVDLSKPAAPAVAASQPKTNGPPATAAVTDPKDPFSVLRSKGKRK